MLINILKIKNKTKLKHNSFFINKRYFVSLKCVRNGVIICARVLTKQTVRALSQNNLDSFNTTDKCEI